MVDSFIHRRVVLLALPNRTLLAVTGTIFPTDTSYAWLIFGASARSKMRLDLSHKGWIAPWM
jgi:hypothetical protein